MPAAVVVYALLALALGRLTWLHSHDDAYITFVFARSFAAGEGLSWNGAPGLGTTSPLLAVALGSLERLLPLGVPVWGHLLAWTAIFATACALLLLGRREGWPAAGALAGFGWLISPAASDFLGGEYPLATAAVTVAALAAARRSAWGLAPSLVLAVGLRSEMAVAAVLIAAAALARDGWRRTRAWLLPGAAGALALWGGWLLALYALTGTVLPATLAAKRAQAESVFSFWHGGWKFLSKTLRAAEGHFYPAGLWLAVAVAAIGLALLVVRWRSREPRPFTLAATLAAWGFAHVAALALLDVPYYPWYSVPLHLSVLVLVCLAVELPGSLRRPGRTPATALAALAVTALLVANAAPNLKRHDRAVEDPRELVYGRLAEWISERYPPSTRVATFEVGYLGYHGRFETLDLLGLTTPETPLEAVKEGDFPRVLRALEPDLVLVPQPFVELGRALVGDARGFLAGYELDHVAGRAWPQVLVYRRRGLAGRGEVAVDLLAGVTREVSVGDPGSRAEYCLVRRPDGVRRGGPCLVLEPGASRRFALDEAGGIELVTAFATRRPPATARLRVEHDGEPLVRRRTHGEPGWEDVAVPLPPGAGALELACDAASAGPCLFLAPHLRRAR